MPKLTYRQQAEAVEQFGEDLKKLVASFDRICHDLSPLIMEEINSIPEQEHLETIAAAFLELGSELCARCDQYEESEDRRRDNPLEPDYRRLGQ
jgi:hypothetical protein